MHEIVNAIQRVKDIVNDINVATEEQNRSLVEVNGSIHCMEHTTKQNGALVQKMNQSTSGLRNMARKLVSTMSYFPTHGGYHLGDDSGSHSQWHHATWTVDLIHTH